MKKITKKSTGIILTLVLVVGLIISQTPKRMAIDPPIGKICMIDPPIGRMMYFIDPPIGR